MNNQDEIKLVKPTMDYEEQVMLYRKNFLDNNEVLHGCASLEDCELYFNWINFDERLSNKYGDKYIKSDVYLAIRVKDNKLIGIVDIRKDLSDHLFKFGGNIGYSIDLNERRKGYGTRVLFLALKICRRYGMRKVLITCNKNNIGSQKVIIANKGYLENEVEHFNKIFNSTDIIQRYWIDVSKRFSDYNFYEGEIKDYKIINKAFDEDNFKGEVVFKKFIEVIRPTILSKNLKILDNNFKWLEFYDYNSNVKLTAIYDDNDEIVEWYFDISNFIGKEFNLPFEDDLYLDVVLTKDNRILLLDIDELENAYNNNYIDKAQFDKAYEVSNQLIKRLTNNYENVKKFTDKFLNILNLEV